MKEEAVTNSTCLIALDCIGALEVLPKVFPAILAPASVQAEYGCPIPWLTVRDARDTAVATALRTQLGDGEANAIALAMELKGGFILLDDKKARRIARQVGLTVLGTLGLLLRVRQEGAIAAVRPHLEAVRDAGFWMTASLYRETLRLAGEQAPA